MVFYRIICQSENGETEEFKDWASRTEYNKLVEEIEHYNFGTVYEAEALTTLKTSETGKGTGCDGNKCEYGKVEE